MGLASMGYYFVRSKKCEVQANFFLANPNLNTAKLVWNYLDDNVTIRKIVEQTMPKVKFHTCIQIKRSQPEITLANIDNLTSMEFYDDLNEVQPFKMESDTKFKNIDEYV